MIGTYAQLIGTYGKLIGTYGKCIPTYAKQIGIYTKLILAQRSVFFSKSSLVDWKLSGDGIFVHSPSLHFILIRLLQSSQPNVYLIQGF